MSERPDVDELAAEQILDLADEAVESREEAKEYIRDHPMTQALKYLVQSGAVERITITLDPESAEKGYFLGLRVQSTGKVSIRLATRHGMETVDIPSLSDSQIAGTCAGLDRTTFQKHAVERVREKTKEIREVN